MMLRPPQLRIVLGAAVLSLLGAVRGWSAEPIAAPPASLGEGSSSGPLLAAPPAPYLGSLAPVDTAAQPVLPAPLDVGLPYDATERAGVVPAARRDAMIISDVPGARRGAQRSLAPQSIGTDGSYYSPSYPTYPVSTGPSTPTTAAEKLMTHPVSNYNPDEATVRISDRPAEQTFGDVPGVRPSHRICPHCRYCQHGLPYHECPECDPCPAMMRRYRARHGLTLPPDYGWSPPGHYPIDRISIDYYRAFPAAWNGQQQACNAVVRPTVYWPTDTTQLGYTYQHSPRWMPYPGMVPPVPHPGQWHIPLCNAYGRCGACGPHGACPHCQPGGASPTPSDATPSKDLPPQPMEAAGYPFGPQLRSSASAPDLAPIPF